MASIHARGFVSRPLRLIVALAVLLSALLVTAVPRPVAAQNCIVANTDDTGMGSLRAALTNNSCDTIDATGVTGTITLGSTLPTITRPLTITGPGRTQLTIEGTNTFVLVVINALGATVTITGLTLTKGKAAGSYGGNIRSIAGNLTLTDVALTDATGNSGTGGAGAYLSNGSFSLTRVLVSGNSLGGDSAFGAGAGLYIEEFYGPTTVTIIDSTIADNHATDGTAGKGGGIAVVKDYTTAARDLTVTLVNTTVSGNTAANAGGGLYVANLTSWVSPIVTLTNSTVAGNSATGLYVGNASSVTLTNTLLANAIANQSANCVKNGTGGVTNTKNNLANDSSCFTDGANGSIVVVIGAVGLVSASPTDNGGPTPTIALTAGSPAINAGDTNTCATALPGGAGGKDQRGVSRPQGAGCDIGAYERLVSPCVVKSTADNGAAGTLRYCLAHTEISAITFDLPAPGPWTIALASDLPMVTRTVSVTGPGPTAASLTVDRNDSSYLATAFPLGSGGDLTLAGLTVTGSYYAVAHVTYDADNDRASVTLTNSTISGNHYGLYLDGSDGGTATLTNSTISGNTNQGLHIYTQATATLTNSTVSNNGSGLHFQNGGTATLTNTTLSGNTIGLDFQNGGTATLTNTLLAKGANANCENVTLANSHHSLADDTSCFTDGSADGTNHTVATGQAGLATTTPQNNGGPTQTIALLPTSPAIDAGNLDTCAAPGAGKVNGKDQRGVSRSGSGSGAHCDIGAYELNPQPSPSPSPSPSSSPSPSPSPAPTVTLTVSTAGAGSGTTTPLGTTTHAQNSVVTLTASPATGSTFTGWTLDGTLKSWATSVTLTMDQGHTVVATFQPTPGFGDVPTGANYADPVAQLAARGIINGCDKEAVPPLFCPGEPTLRHQMAALIARAMPGWVDETGLPTFSDNTDDTELMTRVATLQRHSVVRGYQDEVCTERGLAPPCYGPLDTVKYGQVLLFIARAMVAHDYWTLQPDDRTIFPDQNGAEGANPDTDQQTRDHRMVVTYIHYVGAPPDVANVHAPFLRAGVAAGGWGDDSSRAWFTRAFWPALQSYFGQDNLP